MKRIIAILLAVVLVAGGVGSFDYVQASVGNEVDLNFFTAYVHSTDGDSVTNVSLLATEKVTVAGIHNTDDATDADVLAPVLTFARDPLVTVVSWEDQDLDSEDPWVWNLPNIPEDQGQQCSVYVAVDSSSFEPGFSVSRTLNTTEFTAPGGTQTLEINTTPAVSMDVLNIMVYIPYDPLVTATITSATGEGVTDWSANNVNISIPNPVVEPVTTYTQNITIKVVLNEGVASASFKPVMYVIAWHDEGSGSTTGTTVEGPMELGTWTWDTTAEPPTEPPTERYSWHWNEQLGKAVVFPAFPTIQYNQVGSSFETHYSYQTDGDSVGNITIERQAWISADLHNGGDGTGEGVVGLSSRGGPILDLSTGYTITDFNQDFWRDGSAYIWDFPIIWEHQGFNAGAGIDQTAVFNTGFSVSRSVLPGTNFPSTGGTQILTLSVIPAEEMDRLEIHGKTHGELDIATYEDVITITSPSEEGINIDFDEHSFNIRVDGIEESDVGELYQWQVTIQIAPLPPEYPAVDVEYMPFIEVRNVRNIDSGSLYGSGPLSGRSLALDGTTVLGTWEWQAEGDYAWWWEERVSRAVHLEGYAEIQGNMVQTSFGTYYIYRTSCDSVPNIAIDQPAWMGSDINNQGDGTGLAVVGPSSEGGPILDLSTTQIVTDLQWEHLDLESEYTWHFPVIDEHQGFNGGASIEQVVVPNTGFSVSRSANQTGFPSTGGTQILTLTVIPEEPMQALEIHGKTWLHDFNNATIESVSGEGNINYDDYNFNIHVDGPETGEYQWQITIQIAPLPPEFLALEYMPRIQVDNIVSSEGGSFFGPGPLSGESRNLAGDTLGAWTWQADGDYYWSWNEQVSKQVVLQGYAVHAYASAPTQEAIDQAIDAGQAWVRTQQHGDGSWYWTHNPGEEPEGPSVGMTGLAVWSLIHGLVPPTDPQVQAGIDFILSRQNRNPADEQNYGAIWSHGPEVYETAIAILALRATANDDYLDEIALAAEYLARCQNDEDVVYYHPEFDGGSTTIDSDYWAYGGWDYGYASVHTDYRAGQEQWEGLPYVRSDLSCTQFAMIGLKVAEEAGVELDEAWPDLWSKAEGFVTRCQNPDGGFTYQPQHEAGGGGGSYGSMSAAGVWCLRMAGVDVLDERVQDGLAWLTCHDFYDRNPRSGTHNHYYFLWTTARAFAVYNRPSELVEGTWYYDYAGYLLATQQENGQWVNPNYGVEDDHESHLNRTEYALLILERAVLPPPPGIDLIHIDIEHMRIEFSPNLNQDEIKILQARLWLEEGESYDLAVDDVTVNVGGVVTTIPAGSWKEKKGIYYFDSPKGVTPEVHMEINPATGQWSLKFCYADVSGINKCGGVHVALVIGDKFTGQNVPMWIDYIVYPPQG